MECLVRRKDKTVAYINKMHNYNPKGTPRPKPKPKKNKEEITERELYQLFYLMNM